MSEKLAFRAHARLLTMLGEQLIKNERVALVELVKNAYDADATRVIVDFRGFDDQFSAGPDASILITDNGIGMTDRLVRTAWMNPATPSKALQKQGEPKTTRGRILQGEKGIGRFATFKLGSEVTLITRALGEEAETTLLVDISALDEEAGVSTASIKLDYYLDDIPALLEVGPPRIFDGQDETGSAHGTQLAISGLRADWSERLLKEAYHDLSRLQPLMWADADSAPNSNDFEVKFLHNGVRLAFDRELGDVFEATLERAVLQVRNGNYDVATRSLNFNLDGRPVTLDIDDAEVRALKPFKDHFLKDQDGKDLPPQTLAAPECGPFEFNFFVFDLDRGSSTPARYSLDGEQKKLVKSHRIYLYRDGIRVYPYGDPQDDWLGIDATRGLEGAGRTLSNDQTVGYVSISQEHNPKLRDKTSREGLVETGRATDDFRALINTVLRYVRGEYQKYLNSKERAKRQELREHRIDSQILAIRNVANLPEKVAKQLDTLESALEAERQLAAMQLARTEQLAGVGLSVETASHDLILASGEALRTARQIVLELKLLDLTGEPAYALASQLVQRLEFISARFKDVQGLFVSTRQKSTNQNVIQLLRRVRSIYDRLHKDAGIVFEVDDEASLDAPSTEAAVLQLLINLVDNATYWLLASPHEPRIIRTFTPDRSTLVVTDSGPGVKERDEPYLFEAFYSGKGEEGKGLGLYIARQNGLRNGFSIELSRTGDTRELPGATFVVRFAEQERLDGNT